MEVLVTGGAGFIGSNLVRRLLSLGHNVRVLDNLSTGSLDNLDGLEGSVDVVRGDIRDGEVVRQVCRGVEVVYHLAALPSVSRSVRDPLASHEVNATGTLTVLIAARDAEVRRFVYASSSSVYGDTPTLPKREDMPVSPRSPYAVSKLAGECYCRAFAHSYGLETVALRFFNVFGPRQDPASHYAAVIPLFITRMLSGLPPIILGDGLQSRDFTYIANTVEACIRAAEETGAIGEAVNVGYGERVALLALVDELNGLLETDLRPVHAAAREGDVRHSQAAVDKALELLGYVPSVSLQRGLTETVSWYGRHRASPAKVS
ncbi:MAG: SDR family oxidoreductase [Actinomycetota bacterium]